MFNSRRICHLRLLDCYRPGPDEGAPSGKAVQRGKRRIDSRIIIYPVAITYFFLSCLVVPRPFWPLANRWYFIIEFYESTDCRFLSPFGSLIWAKWPLGQNSECMREKSGCEGGGRETWWIGKGRGGVGPVSFSMRLTLCCMTWMCNVNVQWWSSSADRVHLCVHHCTKRCSFLLQLLDLSLLFICRLHVAETLWGNKINLSPFAFLIWMCTRRGVTLVLYRPLGGHVSLIAFLDFTICLMYFWKNINKLIDWFISWMIECMMT